MSEAGHVRIAVLGGMFSGNKGAASMLHALLDNLPRCEFDVLTIYPKADAKTDIPPGVRVVSCTPGALLFPIFPLSLAAAVLRTFHLPYKFLCVLPAMRALVRADVVVDMAGISFSDGRGIPVLGYNFLMTSVPLLLGGKVVKVAQALGPFRLTLNRILAKLVLPRLKAICARGPETEKHLRNLGLKNIKPAADMAFCMKVPDDARRKIDQLVDKGNFVGLAPSAVVERYCDSIGIDYAKMLAGFVDEIVAEFNMPVLIFAHSSLASGKRNRMNDVPVCIETFDQVNRRDKCALMADDYTPAELRAIIDRCDILVTSRFHAMISALATETPVLVVGWSHKYAETLDEFGMAKWLIGYEDISADGLAGMFRSLVAERWEVRSKIRDRLDSVIAEARVNFDVIAKALE